MADIDRSGCDARRHGNLSAYQRYGCRCPDADNDRYCYYKRYRNGLPYRRRIEAVGAIRRIEALHAIGHTTAAIAAAADMHPEAVRAVRGQRWVGRRTAARIDVAYRQLAATEGRSEYHRRRARREGWATPQQWGYLDDPTAIDDPDLWADPNADTDPDHVDEILVGLVLEAKVHPSQLSPAERAFAVAVGTSRGYAVTFLAERLRTSNRVIRDILNSLAATAANPELEPAA